jgi:YD repeat-containing protein
VTDARGAVTAYTYNNRGLVTGVNSALPPVQGTPAPSATNTLQSGQSLTAGQFITSPNGAYKLIYQTDGNLVLYNATNNTPLWTIGVTGAPGSTQMQADGNLVVYNSNNSPVWQSQTNNGDVGSRLVVQDDGNTCFIEVTTRRRGQPIRTSVCCSRQPTRRSLTNTTLPATASG